MARTDPKHVDVFGVPMDLGGNRRGTDMGPSAFRIAGLEARLRSIGHEVTDHGDVEVESRERGPIGPERAKYVGLIARACDRLREQVVDSLRHGHLPLMIGGDHSVAMGSVAGVAGFYREQGEKIGLIWVDAHADMNTPETSPTGNVHGMPLSALLGQGAPEVVGLGGFQPKVLPAHVALIGIRDLDPREREYVAHSGVSVYTMKEIDQFGINTVAQRAIEVVTRGTAGLHLSFDLDGIDPLLAPGVGTPVKGGLNYRESHLLMELIADSGHLLALDMVEHNPILDTQNTTAELGVGLILSALGRKIL